MTTMTRAFRDLWLKRCTDGTFIQASTVLVSDDDDKRRCCLGVAHAVGKELGLLPADSVCIPNDDDEEYLPYRVAELLGIADHDQSEFAIANDYKFIPEGQYYPNEVLELIKSHPVVD